VNILIITLTDDPFDPPGESRYGGAQRFMFDLGRHLVRVGHFVLFVTRHSRPGKPLQQTFGERCTVRRLQLGPPEERTHHELWEFQEAIEAQIRALTDGTSRFDVVLSFNWLSGLAAIASGIRPHVHHILSLGRVRLALRELAHPSDAARDCGEVAVFSHADRLICVCRDELRSLQLLYPEIDSSKGRIIPYGIDGTIFYRRPCDADAYVRRSFEGFEERP